MVLIAGDDRLPGLLPRQVFSERRAVGTLLLWVPFFMGFGLLAMAVLWTPSLLRLNRISPSAAAFVVAFNGLGAAIGQGAAGRLVERLGVAATVVPGFVLGAAATAGLGYGASSVGLAAMFIGLNGLFIGVGTGGFIALAAMIYPTAVRSSGVGLAMAAGRFRQMAGPLLAGAMLGAGLRADQIMPVIAVGGLIGAVFTLLFRGWAARRSEDARSEIEAAVI